MKKRRPLFIVIILTAMLTAIALTGKSPVRSAEGQNAEYARLANGVVPAVTRIAGRSFSGRVEIKGISQPEMQAIMAEDIAMVRASGLNAQDVVWHSEALSAVTPMYYSIARRRIYFSPEAIQQRLKDGRLNPRWETEALRLLLAFELVRFLDDQQADLKKLLSNAVSAEQARAYRAITSGHARFVVEKIAMEWSRPGLGQLVARWSLGEGAGRGLDQKVTLAMDEEFSFCFDGGYRFAAYIYENRGADGFYRTYSNPPVSASTLFDPIQYRAEGNAAPSVPAAKQQTSIASGSPSGPDFIGALRESRRFLPDDDWEEKIQTYNDYLASLDSKERAEYEELFLDYVDVFLGAEAEGRVVLLSGGRARHEVPEEFVHEMVTSLEEMASEIADELDSIPHFQDPIPLAGLGYGSGWVKFGRIGPASKSTGVSCWLVACRSGQDFLYALAINCPLTQDQITEMFTAMLAKLQ